MSQRCWVSDSPRCWQSVVAGERSSISSVIPAGEVTHAQPTGRRIRQKEKKVRALYRVNDGDQRRRSCGWRFETLTQRRRETTAEFAALTSGSVPTGTKHELIMQTQPPREPSPDAAARSRLGERTLTPGGGQIKMHLEIVIFSCVNESKPLDGSK